MALLFGVLVLSALLWIVHRQSGAIAALKAEATLARQEKDEALTKAEALAKANSRRENSLQVAASRAPAPTIPPAGDVPFENALDGWMAKIRTLNAFIDRHPEWSISQMNLLTATDWLDATKTAKLETEADFRKALGRLRGMARQKTAGVVSKALGLAMAANGGQVPANPQVLTPYLPAGFDSGILQQVSVNPSGEVPGLRIFGGGKSQFFLVDKPVDDLWDATLFYGKDGGSGSRGSSAPGEGKVSDAIAQFTASMGAPPVSAVQLAQYPGIAAIDPAVLDEIFRAMTTKPDP